MALLNRYERRLLSFTAHFVPPAIASEIVQEAYFRLWQEDEEKTKGHEAQWLYRVCRNLALNYKERSMAEKELKLQVSILHSSLFAGDAEAGLQQKQQSEIVQRLLNELPEKTQEVLRLKFLDGLSYKEISCRQFHCYRCHYDIRTMYPVELPQLVSELELVRLA